MKGNMKQSAVWH